MHFSITETPDDASGRRHVTWELHDGPLIEHGTAPSLVKALIAITRARRAIAHDLHHDSGAANPHRSPNPAAIHFQTPQGDALPAQQDVPASSHPDALQRLQLSLPGFG
jgi:hypothetical protein